MTTTYGNLADRIDTLLHGYSVSNESTTWLTTSITSASTSFTVYDVSNVGRGFIQIDDELMYVNSTDNTTGTVYLAPWGRGQRGSAVAEHTTNAKVTVAPLFPRSEIKKAINETIDSMYPQIFGVDQTEFAYVAARTTYDLPDSAEQILSITHSVIGPSREWMPVRAYKFDRTANPGAFGTGGELGKSITVDDRITPGRTVSVVYAKRPTLMTNDSDDFAGVTGLPSYSLDAVIYGTAFRMVSFLDPSRLGPQSAEADTLDTQRGNRSGETAASFLFRIYQTRVTEVAENQRRQYPIRSHYQK